MTIKNSYYTVGFIFWLISLIFLASGNVPLWSLFLTLAATFFIFGRKR